MVAIITMTIMAAIILADTILVDMAVTAAAGRRGDAPVALARIAGPWAALHKSPSLAMIRAQGTVTPDGVG
ncbi:hypothetical protein AA13595_2519 [Gluconacetobacter johannae DSM 13595]|nr:hypothetical protein AA13595_2519 [Gluconacetobacter johannae DSM 13595]